ncbi:MAG: hypothetical protein KTR17_04210, partial [Cellvibrionaceae bacterium]|nr:hypothetical protein [Cellvibrionaceae bacterium]
LEFLLAYIKGAHIQGLPCLYVASSNRPAKSLYKRYGFTVTETFETTYNQKPVIAEKMVIPALAQRDNSAS